MSKSGSADTARDGEYGVPEAGDILMLGSSVDGDGVSSLKGLNS